jgi:hypothetical protein
MQDLLKKINNECGTAKTIRGESKESTSTGRIGTIPSNKVLQLKKVNGIQFCKSREKTPTNKDTVGFIKFAPGNSGKKLQTKGNNIQDKLFQYEKIIKEKNSEIEK